MGVEFKRHQYFNLLHILVVAPAIWLAVSPTLMEKLKVSPETVYIILKVVIVGMIIFHGYRFLSGFDSVKDFFQKMMEKKMLSEPVVVEKKMLPEPLVMEEKMVVSEPTDEKVEVQMEELMSPMANIVGFS